MAPIFENTSKQKFEDMIHQRNFNSLGALLDQDEDQFNKIRCLAPVCDSTNRDFECRKAAAVQHLINGISLHGTTWIDDAVDFCSCAELACNCEQALPTTFPTSFLE